MPTNRMRSSEAATGIQVPGPLIMRISGRTDNTMRKDAAKANAVVNGVDTQLCITSRLRGMEYMPAHRFIKSGGTLCQLVESVDAAIKCRGAYTSADKTASSRNNSDVCPPDPSTASVVTRRLSRDNSKDLWIVFSGQVIIPFGRPLLIFIDMDTPRTTTSSKSSAGPLVNSSE